MEYSTPSQYIENWLEGLEMERSHQEKMAIAVLTDDLVHERKKQGYCWYPVDIEDGGFTLGELPFITAGKNVEKQTKDHFQSGQPVRVFRLKKGEVTHETRGIIHYLHRGKMKVILHEEFLPDWLFEGGIGVDQVHDEKTYDQMRSAMEKLLHLKSNHPAKKLVWTFYGNSQPEEIRKREKATQTETLNPSQIEAVEAGINAEDISVIHGPPGTGKTTTLKHLIINLVQRKNKVLVCAPSNAATDWIASQLYREGLKVVRMGHLSRIDQEVLDCSLESQVFSKNEARQLKKIHLEAEECFRQAKKYKRSYGPQQREERRRLFAEARNLKKWARELENRLVADVLERAEVICSTLSGANNHWMEGIEFNYCVIDEAAQALQGACWIAMLKAQKIILAGDPWQLPPTVKSREAEKTEFGKTLLDLAISKFPRLYLLNTQYRMNNIIMGLSNEWFYRGKLKAHESVANHQISTDKEAREAIEFIDTAGCGFFEKQNPETKSYHNKDEYLIIREHLEPLLHAEYVDAPQMSIISPYSAQVQFITEEMEEDSPAFPVTVATIDSFQGQERDIVYITLVRSNEEQQIGFLRDYRRMNVAMTRAKKKLILVGDSATLAGDEFYETLLHYIEKNGSYRSAWEFIQ
ncbi:MAG: AAA family ATPase [Saprospirales bacterium]|nr:MAG: AAA family ATPase [Saprospirales bacterium]